MLQAKNFQALLNSGCYKDRKQLAEIVHRVKNTLLLFIQKGEINKYFAFISSKGWRR
jgi:hypothetical protein